MKAQPAPRPLPKPPAKPVRDILGLLLAATGFALAARRDARVELLPGHPVTVVIKTGNASAEPAAAFVLPAVTLGEAARLFGAPALADRDRVLEQVLEEERQSALCDPEVLLDQRRGWAMEEDDGYGLC